jgi:hypothetical protein
MTIDPNEVADLFRDAGTSNDAVQDQRSRAYRAADIAARGAWTADLGATTPKPALTREPGTAWLTARVPERAGSGCGQWIIARRLRWTVVRPIRC